VAKVLCVLYDDPVDGYPRSYARDTIPRIERYYDGQTTPTPERIDFEPGELLGSVSGELGLRRFLEERGHAFVVTSDKDGPDSVFERELPNAEIVISQPFWPAYLTAERIAKAPRSGASDRASVRQLFQASAMADKSRENCNNLIPSRQLGIMANSECVP
jgi:formate dehydrogenase